MANTRIKTASETVSADYNIARMLEEPDGFNKIALEKLPPFIRELRDYEAFGRKILMTHNVSSEDLHLIDGEPYVYYPKDQNAHAAFFGDDAETPRYQVEGDGVNVGIMTIISDNHTIHLKRLMVQKYQYLERVRELSAQSMVKAEDLKIIELTERLLMGNGGDGATGHSAPANAGQIATTTSTVLQKNDLIGLMQKISQNDIPVGAFVMNQATIQDTLKWGFGTTGSDIDQLTQREMLETGVKYKFWNIPMVTSRIIPRTLVYCYADKEFVGRMPILKDLTVELTNTSTRLEKGLFMYEFVGMYLASQKAVAKLIIGFTDGDKKIHLTSDAEGVYAREMEIIKDIKGYGSREGR